VLSHLEVRVQQEEPPRDELPPQAPPPRSRPVQAAGGGTMPATAAAAALGVDTLELEPADPERWGKVSRNAPCPCGSGRKFKQCHGRLA
jgi:preprotein translocase subunit SecA